MAVLVAQLELEVEAPLARGLLGDGAQRRLEPGLLEDVGMQLEDRLPDLPDRLGERVVRPAKGGMDARLLRFLELVARREQVLQRLVVQRLGQRLPLTLLGVERVREQA